MRTPPTLTRVDAVTLLGGLTPEQPIDRACHGRCACVADADGLWVVDLPSARVVTHMAVPGGMVSHHVLNDGAMLAAFSAPRRAVTLRRGVHGGAERIDRLVGLSPEARDATRPVLIQAWSDGGVALALPRPIGDTALVVRGETVATFPAWLGAPQHTFAPARGLDLYYFTAGPHRTVRGVWLPP